MRLFFVCLFLSALPISAQEVLPADDEITVTDTEPLCTVAGTTGMTVLPVRLLDIPLLASPEPTPRAPLVLDWPAVAAPRPHTFALRIAVGGISRRTCDPFGRLGVECGYSRSPAATISLGSTWWSLDVSGSRSTGAVRRNSGDAVLTAQAGRIGPVRIGITLEAQVESWYRTVYRFEDTTLGTTRNLEAGFGGVHVGVGDYSGRHLRLVLLGGYWRSIYRGTLAVPAFSGYETLAHDEFGLGRVRLEAGSIPIGSRTRISGTAQRSWAFLTSQHPSVSPVVPPAQWSVTVDASVRAWSMTPRSHMEVALYSRVSTGELPLLDDTAVGLSLAWRFR